MPKITGSVKINCPELKCFYGDHHAAVRMTVSDGPATINIVMCGECAKRLKTGGNMIAALYNRDEMITSQERKAIGVKFDGVQHTYSEKPDLYLFTATKGPAKHSQFSSTDPSLESVTQALRKAEKRFLGTCRKCGGSGLIKYYHNAGDHFSGNTSPFSEWRTAPCDVCNT